MKKQVVTLAVVATLSLLGLVACSANSGDVAKNASISEGISGSAQSSQEGVGKDGADSVSIDPALKYKVTLKVGTAPVIEYGTPVGAVGGSVMSNSDSDHVLFIFDCANLSNEGVEGTSSSQVLSALGDRIVRSEHTCVSAIAFEELNIDNQSDVSIAGTRMTKYIGTLSGEEGSRPFVGYAAVTDDLATWFFVVDDSKDASNSQDVLENWADKVAQTYRVVS